MLTDDSTKEFDLNNTSSLVQTGVQLQLKSDRTDTVVPAVVIGIEYDKHLIVKLLSKGYQDLFLQGDAISVRFFYNGILCNFYSVIINVLLEPSDLIIINYPENIERFNIRAYKRVACLLPAKIQYKDIVGDGTVINISHGGCRLMLKNVYSVESSNICIRFDDSDKLRITITLPNIAKELALDGTIRNTSTDGNEEYYGIEFDGCNESENKLLGDYIQVVEKIELDHYFLLALYSMLQISMDKIRIEDQLKQVLALILSIPGLSLQSRGSIHVIEKESDTLIMKTNIGFIGDINVECRRLPDEQCICSMKTLQKNMVFVDSINDNNIIQARCTNHDGHYCIPIVSENDGLGVLHICIKAGYKTDKTVENYLISVSNIIAGLIVRNNVQTKQEKLVKELQLTNEQLMQSQEQLVQSEKMRSLGQLAAGIAHEINNPLGFVHSNINTLGHFVNRIFGLVKKFDTYDIPEQIKTEFEQIKADIKYDYLVNRINKIIERSIVGIDRIKNIVLDLKTYSRLDQSKVKETNINESLDITLSLLVHEFKDRIEIIRDYTDIPHIRCNSANLNQVFMNILINACQSITGKGHVKISTFTKQGDACIKISDTGSGIPKNIIDKIFDPFFTTKGIGKGTGLGLSTSYGIIQKHRGSISVQSEEGRGSAFTIKIPMDCTFYEE